MTCTDYTVSDRVLLRKMKIVPPDEAVQLSGETVALEHYRAILAELTNTQRERSTVIECAKFSQKQARDLTFALLIAVLIGLLGWGMFGLRILQHR